MSKYESVEKSFELAKRVFADYGVDAEQALTRFSRIPVSLHNWQADDVTGFENLGDIHSENVVTGNYPGKPRNAEEMRKDIEFAFSCSPCRPRVNLQSIYAEPKAKKDRNEYETEDFRNWIDWASARGYGLDFNVSYFRHPMMVDGFSLASPRRDVREYWIQAGIGSRRIADDIGKALGTPCVNNLWIPDGMKDLPANRRLFRENLTQSLDAIFAQKYSPEHTLDTLEGKVFSIAVEAFTVGSHDYYVAYAAKNGLGVCMDTGHYHPTETIIDKITSVRPFVSCIMLHLSRGIRWDSDHTLICSDELTAIMQELKRADYIGNNIFIGLDYFDASINRVASWIVGLRAAGKALLTALLEPTDMLFKAEAGGDYTSRLALMEEIKNLPVHAVWDMACIRKEAGVREDWLGRMKKYESDVQLKR
jgi:L-rhamnose isomerase